MSSAGDSEISRWSLWRKRKRVVEKHMQSVNAKRLAYCESSSTVDDNSDTDSCVDPSTSNGNGTPAAGDDTPLSPCECVAEELSVSDDDVANDSTVEADPVPELNFDQFEGHGRPASETDQDQVRHVGAESPGHSDDEFHEANCELFEDFDDCGYYSPTDSDGSSSESEDEFEKESRFKEHIAQWAANSLIPHNKVKGLLSVLREFHPNLPKDPRTLLGTSTSYQINSIAGGDYYHFGLADSIRDLASELSSCVDMVQDKFQVSIQINVDGLPLFKSAKTQFWPILGRVADPFQSEVFIIGLFSGNSKPSDVHEYLGEFVSEVKDIEQNGVKIDGFDTRLKVHLSCFICDAPARAYIKQTKLHNAYYGCDKCIQKGTWVNKVTLPDIDSPLRTDVAFNEMTNKEHHVGVSPLSQLSIGMVTQFPHDPMHLVYLGVVKRLIWSWVKGPVANKCRIGSNACSQISASLLSCHAYVPREFARKCRSLAEFERWKATELRQFLLYSGIVALKGKVSDIFYSHFLLFFVAIFCMSSSLHHPTHCDYADILLRLFVQDWSKLYGQDMVVYNVHGLIHLATESKKFGLLDSFSAFPFESFLGRLKKLVRKPNSVLPQVIRRLSEIKPKRGDWKKKCETGVISKEEHANGPVLLRYRGYTQFKCMQLNGLFFSIRDRDNCVKIASRFGLIRNICKDPNESEPLVMFEHFSSVEDFFQYPLNSSDLGIVKVSHLSGILRAEKVSRIVTKYFRVPHKESFVLVPLLHQFY